MVNDSSTSSTVLKKGLRNLEGDFSVYHDESGADTKHEPYLMHGMLIVPLYYWEVMHNELSELRNGYKSRIHFVDLRDKSTSLRSTVAHAWTKRYFEEWHKHVFYKCCTFDSKAEKDNYPDYLGAYRYYNSSFIRTLYSAVNWSLHQYTKVGLRVYSESRSLSVEDPFETWVLVKTRQKVEAKIQTRRGTCPRVSFPDKKVIMIPGDAAAASVDECPHCDFVQLTDLLTASINEAINARATQAKKRGLGALVGELVLDSRRVPWQQRRGLHRRFSVSSFDGDRFDDLPLAIFTTATE